jgi:hypothetical protein
LPHNEYLRLLVDGGLVGAALYGLAALAWGWRVLDLIRPGERPFAWALFLALGAYALTGNVLIMPAGVLPFLYLAILQIPSARRCAVGPGTAHPAPEAPPSRHRSPERRSNAALGGRSRRIADARGATTGRAPRCRACAADPSGDAGAAISPRA